MEANSPDGPKPEQSEKPKFIKSTSYAAYGQDTGSIINAIYMKTNMKFYPVSEDAIQNIGIHNGLVFVFSSLGGAALMFAAACQWDITTATEIRIEPAKFLRNTALVFAGVFYVITVGHWIARALKLRAIRKNSEEIK